MAETSCKKCGAVWLRRDVCLCESNLIMSLQSELAEAQRQLEEARREASGYHSQLVIANQDLAVAEQLLTASFEQILNGKFTPLEDFAKEQGWEAAGMAIVGEMEVGNDDL